ncbi:hypothetical protein HZ326_17024 [Fusarium oxysporum f. sp. albedinis]|nr:hypothetical protein HZ326_17024 [Fusarium oxysporum f. sp. albedinis]
MYLAEFPMHSAADTDTKLKMSWRASFNLKASRYLPRDSTFQGLSFPLTSSHIAHHISHNPPSSTPPPSSFLTPPFVPHSP